MSRPPASRIAYLCLQATRQGQASHAHVREIIAGLERRGISVDLFEPRYASGAEEAPGAVGRAAEFLRVQRRLRRQAADIGALYVRAHFASEVALAWARRVGMPVVIEVNGPYNDLFEAWPQTRRFERRLVGLMRRQYAEADALVAVTPQLAGWLAEETGRSDITVIPNGANTELFRPGAPAPDGLPERYVLFFGALAPWQGLDSLLGAVSHPAWPEDVALVIAGDGPGRAEVEKAAARTPRVVYLETVPYRDMPGVIGRAMAGVIPKSGRGQRHVTGLSPLKLYETMACGAPVVVTDLPGQADLVREHDAGVVVRPDDPAALADAVERIANDARSARRMGERGRAAVVAEHSWDARAEATAGLLARVIGPGAGR